MQTHKTDKHSHQISPKHRSQHAETHSNSGTDTMWNQIPPPPPEILHLSQTPRNTYANNDVHNAVWTVLGMRDISWITSTCCRLPWVCTGFNTRTHQRGQQQGGPSWTHMKKQCFISYMSHWIKRPCPVQSQQISCLLAKHLAAKEPHVFFRSWWRPNTGAKRRVNTGLNIQ